MRTTGTAAFVRFVAIGLLLAAPTALLAEGSVWPNGKGPYLGLDLMVGTPSATADVFRNAFFGGSLRFIASEHFELSLDYAFMETEYYYPESINGPWAGPVPWNSMPARFEDRRGDWIFYHTKHFLSPQLWLIAPIERAQAPLFARFGAGPAISFLVPNEAAKYYPGLSDAFEVFNESFETYLGLSLRAGLEYRPWEHIRVGAEYLFIADSLADAGEDIARLGWEYLSRSGNFVVTAGVRL